MNIFPLRLAVLAAAVTVSASFRASAQTDAAFASALSKAPSGLATMAQLKTQSQVPAAALAQGPVAPGGDWKKALERVRLDGVAGESEGFITRSLTIAARDAAGDRRIHGIIVFYFVDANGSLKVAGVELSLEQSVLKTGTIRTDYWLMIAKPSGRVDQAVYRQRVDVPGEEIIPGVPVAVDLADPEVKARFDEMLAFWSSR